MKGRHSLQKYLRCKWKGKTSRAIEISKFRGKIIPRRCKPIFEYRRQQDGRNSSGNNSSQSFIDDTIVACNSLNGRLSHWRSRARARTSVRSPRVGEWQKNIFSNSLTNLDLRTDVSPEPWRSITGRKRMWRDRGSFKATVERKTRGIWLVKRA